MIWCSMAWYIMVWYGIVWYGMVQYGVVWHGTLWCGMVQKTLTNKLTKDSNPPVSYSFFFKSLFISLSYQTKSRHTIFDMFINTLHILQEIMTIIMTYIEFLKKCDRIK